MTRHWPLALAIWFGAMAAPTPALADKKEARPIFLEANEEYRAGNYQRALELYQRAYDLYPSEKILLNQATCLADMGRDAEAANLYLQYVEVSPDGELRAQVRTVLHELAQKIGRVKISAQSAETTIYVDGEKHRDPAPTILWLAPGTHRIVLEGGGERRTQQVALDAGDLTELDASGMEEDDDEPAGELDSTHDTAATVEKSSSGERSGLKTAAWVTGAAGLVALGIGVKYGLDVRDLNRQLSGTEEPWNDELQARHDQGERAENRMFLFTGIGAAAVVGGAVLYYLSRDDGKPSASVTVSGDSVSLGIAGSF